jgi:uncharacterized repeat protein (TIGR01451 family)
MSLILTETYPPAIALKVPMRVPCALALLLLALAAPAAARAATADVAVQMSGPQFAAVGVDASYDVTIANRGPSPTAGVTLSDPIPAGARLVRTVAGDSDCTPGATLVCTVPPIPVGASRVVTIVLAGTTVGATLHHAVAVTATSSDPTTTDLDAAIDTLITPPSVAPPGSPLVGAPCTNVHRGGRDDDVINGTTFGDTIYGLERSDLLRGLDGADCLWGGEGNDVLDGDGGDDRLWGGNGRDRLIGGDGNDVLYGGLKGDVLIGGPGDDTISPGTGRDLIRAGAGNDVINARDGSRDVIECASGVDRVVADRRDRLRGCEQVTKR